MKMARIIVDGDKNMSPEEKKCGGRKLSFKTRGGGSKVSCRATKVSLPSNSVQEIASKFNAIIVEDETKGRALLKKLQKPQSGLTVREAVLKFENVADKPKMVLVRKNSQPKIPKKLNALKEETDTPKPEIRPKPEKASKPVKTLEIVKNEKKLSIPKNDILYSVFNDVKPTVKPNSSFLWGTKDNKETKDKTVLPTPVPEEPVENVKEDTKEDKENKKSEASQERSNIGKGYGKINNPEPKANVSSLYRHLLKGAPALQENNYIQNPSESTYEDIITKSYEEVENSYDVIHYGNADDVIYDDVLNVNDIGQNEGIYESIYDTRTGSDSSYEQSNSLYEARPSSRASSGSGAVVSGTSKSDTSDDWVDIEVEEKEEILVLQDTSKPKTTFDSWSQKVRRQWNHKLQEELAVSSSSLIYFSWAEPENEKIIEEPPVVNLKTKGLVSLREIYYPGCKYEIQEVTLFLTEGETDSNGLHYEAVESPYDALCDDFSSESDSDTENKVPAQNQNRPERPASPQSEGIYSFMRTAKKKMRKTSLSFGQRLRRISRISMAVPVPSAAEQVTHSVSAENISRGKWPSFKKKNPQSNSTFYLDASEVASEEKRRESVPKTDVRRHSASIRPTSPPPPPPINGEKKPINDASLYMECGLFENSVIQNNDRSKLRDQSWYSDVGLYENSKPSDTMSEHDSTASSDLDLRFANEPLYQFYAASVAELERAEAASEVGYEEIKKNEKNISENRPSALDLVSSERHRTLWSQVPQVINSGILDSLSPEKRRLQEAKFELITSEASYYKSLVVLEKHFAASPLFKDETLVPKVDYKTLFGNINHVRRCSEAVLAALEKCWQESILLEGVCDIVCQLTQERFSVYITYCKHQIAIERTLKNLKKSNTFLEALNALESSPKCHSLSLYSFLLLPMQRITRMPLLLDAILTKLTPSDSEYDSCKMALTKLSKVVHDCNEAARQTERLEEMVLLSHSLNFPPKIRRLPLLSESRWLVRSGQVTQVNIEPKLTLSKKLTTGRSTSKRTLFLFTDYLILAKKKGEDNYMVVTFCARKFVQMTSYEDPLIPHKYLIMVTLLENHEGKTEEMIMSCGSESSRERWLLAFMPPKSKDPNEVLYESWDCPQVSAIHPYTSTQPDELTLQPGDVINVHRKTDGWFYGERTRDREEGWFPGNHTVEIASSHIRARNLKQRHRLLAFSSTFILNKQNMKNEN